MSLSRRTALLGATGLAAALATRPGAARSLNARDPANTLQAYMRMRGNGVGRLALWFYTARAWGRPVDAVAQVMFTVSGLTYQRLAWNADGSIEQKMAGRGYYGDPATGVPLESWTNPYTLDTVTPPHVKSLALQRVLPDGKLTPVGENGTRSFFDGRVGNHTVDGDTIWLTENFIGKGAPDPARGGVAPATTSLTTFTARIEDVESESRGFVPCYLNYQSLGDWPGWMKMGGRAGMLSWQTWGHKITGTQQGPKALRDWIEAHHPGFLKDPGI
jgi:hypothetical protein